MQPLAEAEILAVHGLSTRFPTEDGTIDAVIDLGFRVRRGETVAIVGESGSGKSITCLSLMRLIEPPGRIVAGQAAFRRRDGRIVDLVAVPEPEMRRIRGDEIAMIFQEPMTSLNPLYTVGDQIAEVVREHRGASRRAAWAEAVELLHRVGIADPARRAEDHPHQMSGGMRQRVMIAIALACRPLLLLADEPTTALDVTIQAQILELLRVLRADAAGGMGIVFVTHNMGVVAEMADRVVVMYAGRVVESGTARDIFHAPRHMYTRGLLASIAHAGAAARAGPRRRLAAIPGNVPDPLDPPPGCAFAPRCGLAEPDCAVAMPGLEEVAPGHLSRCRRWRAM